MADPAKSLQVIRSRPLLKGLLVLLLVGALGGLAWYLVRADRPAPLPAPPTDYEPGQIASNQDLFGPFYVYVPTSVPAHPAIVVLVHGTPKPPDTAESVAQFCITQWQPFAEAEGLILIAPAFNQEDFSSTIGDHALGGYRGLFGRQINADEWVLRLVRAYQKAFEQPEDGRFYLYGHSAGGQFVARFIVTHPEVVEKAVITSAATYPHPDPEIAWPYGLGKLETDIEWDADSTRHVDVQPDPQKWLAATQIPLTVIVGMNDTSELPAYPGQQGKNRFTIGRHWVRAMAEFAQQHGMESRFEFEMIPAVGHSLAGLLSYSEAALYP